MKKKLLRLFIGFLSVTALFFVLATVAFAEAETGDIYISKMGADNAAENKSRWNNTAILYIDENGETLTDPSEYVPSGLTWSFENGVMTVSGQLKKINGKDATWSIPYPSSGRASITEIIIEASITTLPDHCFNYLTTVKKVTVPKTLTKLENESCSRMSSLTTFIVAGSGTYEDFWIDLRNITSCVSNTFQDSFPSSEINIMLGKEIYNLSNASFGAKSSTAVFHIYVPTGQEECKWVKSITEGRTVNFTVDVRNYVEGAVKELGYQVRTKEYNGLRAKFKYDGTKTDGNYTLKEFGAVAGKVSNIEKYGYTLVKNGFGEYVTADVSVKKIAINDTDLQSGGVFYVSIVNYSTKEQMEASVFMCAYEIWSDASGNDKIVYSANVESHCKPISIWEATASMYKAGLVNTSIDENNLFWNILDKFIYKPELTTMGIELGDSFGYTIDENGSLIDKTNSNVSVNIFKLGETYTAIVKGSGTFSGGAYNAGGVVDPDTGKRDWTIRNHLDEAYIGIPIDTVVVDEGITATKSNAFRAFTSVKTIIYSNSLKNLGSQTFHTMKGLTTVVPFDYALAKKNSNYVEGKYGIADLSGILYYVSDYLFYLCGYIEQIILPSASGTKGELNERFVGSCSSLRKIYCITAEIPEDGVADFRGTGWSFNLENEHTGDDKGKRVFQYANKIIHIIDDFAEYEKTDEKPQYLSYTGTWKAVQK